LGVLRAAQTPARAPSVGSPPPGSADTAADAAAGRDEDFQRFLRYVRSLGR